MFNKAPAPQPTAQPAQPTANPFDQLFNKAPAPVPAPVVEQPPAPTPAPQPEAPAPTETPAAQPVTPTLEPATEAQAPQPDPTPQPVAEQSVTPVPEPSTVSQPVTEQPAVPVSEPVVEQAPANPEPVVEQPVTPTPEPVVEQPVAPAPEPVVEQPPANPDAAPTPVVEQAPTQPTPEQRANPEPTQPTAEQAPSSPKRTQDTRLHDAGKEITDAIPDGVKEIAKDTAQYVSNAIPDVVKDVAEPVMDVLGYLPEKGGTVVRRTARNLGISQADAQDLGDVTEFGLDCVTLAGVGKGVKLTANAVKKAKAIKKAAKIEQGVTNLPKEASETLPNSVMQGSELSSEWKEILSKAEKVDNRLETKLGDGSKVVFRKDFGEHAHAIGKEYPNPVDHYNVEIHKLIPGTNRFEKIKNSHIIVNETGDIIDVFIK